MASLVRPRSPARLLALLALLAPLSAAGGCGAGAASTDPTSPTRQGAPPDFELETLSGPPFRLSDHLGKEVVLLDFWATFCEPCLTAMPQLDAIYQRHRDRGFVVAGVAIDGPETVAQVRQTAKKLGVTFPVLLDQETRVLSMYNPRTSAPYSVLIDRSGNVVMVKEGYAAGDMEALERELEALLAAPAAQ